MQVSRALGVANLVWAALIGTGCGDSFSTESNLRADAGTGGRSAMGSGGGPSTGGTGAGASSGGSPTGGADAGASSDASATGEGGRVTADGASGAGGGPPSEAGPAIPVEIDLEIQHDTDDATWINGDDERLAYSSDQLFDEVGADTEMGRAGYRFEPPIPPGSVIKSAVLRLHRVDGLAADTDTIVAQVLESATVPPFDSNDVHPPAGHVAGGLSSLIVSGFVVGGNDASVDSPDLTELVQHVVNRPDWTATGSIGVVLSPDTLTTWVGFADSSSGSNAARLRITYVPPGR